MSIQYCENCDKHIDTDFNAEHFETGSDCHDRTELLSKYSQVEKKSSSWIKEIIGMSVIFTLLVVGLYALGIYQIISN